MADLLAADAVVIGAGCAGLAAAVRLAGAGRRVVVVDEAPRLGGRTTSFTDRETGERVDNGQHVVFGCYRETYEYLRAIGTASLAPFEPSLTVAIADADGRAPVLRCPRLPPPWHLALGLLRWRALPLRDRLSSHGLRPVLLAARRVGPARVAAEVDPALTVSGWLAAHGQSPALRRRLWDPLVVAALNQSPETAAAQPFVRVLAEMFAGDAASAAIGLPRAPLDEVFAAPAARYVEARGGHVLLRRPAAVRIAGTRRFQVGVGPVVIQTGAVVSAVPWHALHRIWSDAPPGELAGTTAAAAAMRPMPIVTVNLWFDRPVFDRAGGAPPFLGYVGGQFQWFFDKAALIGGGAQHVAAVMSGAVEIVRLDNAAIAGLAERDARSALRLARSAALVRSVVVREPRATFSLAPGQPPRPAARTAIAGFVLAGDWTDTGLPATIEGAVQSGHRAAEAVIRDL